MRWGKNNVKPFSITEKSTRAWWPTKTFSQLEPSYCKDKDYSYALSKQPGIGGIAQGNIQNAATNLSAPFTQGQSIANGVKVTSVYDDDYYAETNSPTDHPFTNENFGYWVWLEKIRVFKKLTAVNSKKKKKFKWIKVAVIPETDYVMRKLQL
jgi:hypothetical protein